jgi:hypothetical protein
LGSYYPLDFTCERKYLNMLMVAFIQTIHSDENVDINLSKKTEVQIRFQSLMFIS